MLISFCTPWLIFVFSAHADFRDAQRVQSCLLEGFRAPPIRLTITDNKIDLKDIESKTVAKGVEVTVDYGSRHYFLSGIPKLRGRFSYVEIFRRAANGNETKISLPEGILANIGWFLTQRGERPVDCNGFVHYLNGVNYVFGTFHYAQWDISEFLNDETIKVGESILMRDSVKDTKHLAIYLGSGLYLSKGGPKGDLVVTSLESMRSLWGGKEVVVIRPKINCANLLSNNVEKSEQ